ncbi:glyoxalase/Bleomycin resistance protein/Dihydroxybiphenyl dioxygenase [Artemisia annua]|uniref:Glyoxalase/Bleomycin resistance protein/Dihydroxybiphenyl dioxygenase n=1 Tax=Artemisia annua TaxID=35608 RepID=A0A2U1LKH1_ARTAN|nr:glyoxalase/Bleomycin resistance protein/Dihydroxybiphenyl dioxygenase [Artemisia annua]
MTNKIVNGGISEIVEEDSYSSKKQMPLLSLNHVSFMCKSVGRSVKFYEDVLGFVLIRRPSSFDFEGAWLFNHGIGIHLLEMDTTPTKKSVINPKDNHISFQCSNMDLIIKKLEEMGIKYVTAVVKEGGVEVNQLFFHDPDGYMIEICNCHVLPVLPISSWCPRKKLPTVSQINHSDSSFYDKMRSKNFCAEDEALMMDNLLVDMMGISF